MKVRNFDITHNGKCFSLPDSHHPNHCATYLKIVCLICGKKKEYPDVSWCVKLLKAYIENYGTSTNEFNEFYLKDSTVDCECFKLYWIAPIID